MIKLGRVTIDAPFCQAGLAGYSDRAMRTVARRRGCPYAVTEALLDVILCAGGEGLRKSIDISDEDHPVAGQIMGSEPETMAKAARLMAQAGFDVIDLNYACPVKKIKNKARGGHMLRDVARAIDIMKACRDAVPPEVPTTISTRRSFDDTPEAAEMFERVVEAAWAHGYAALRVHARTVEQKYQGRAWWDFLKQFKARNPDRIIFGSGDLFTAHDAVRLLTETRVDLAWIARGAIGNPWIFNHARHLLEEASTRTLPTPDRPSPQSPIRNPQSAIEHPTSDIPHPTSLPPPTLHEQRSALTEHFALAMDIHGEQLAGRRMRKMGIKYSRFHPQAAEVKSAFIAVHSLRDWQSVLDRFYAADAPGVWPPPDAPDEVNGESVGDPSLQSCDPSP